MNMTFREHDDNEDFDLIIMMHFNSRNYHESIYNKDRNNKYIRNEIKFDS